MVKLEKFDGSRTYMFPNSDIATPEIIRQKFPAVDNFVHVIEVNGDVCQAVMNLNALRSMHNIDEGLSEKDAIQAIEDVINTPPEVIISPEERLAAAAEFQNIVSLPDTTEIADIKSDKVIESNVKQGLWGKPHIDVVVKKGLLTQERADALLS